MDELDNYKNELEELRETLKNYSIKKSLLHSFYLVLLGEGLSVLFFYNNPDLLKEIMIQIMSVCVVLSGIEISISSIYRHYINKNIKSLENDINNHLHL